jgi:serine/threonine protein kinase
MSYIGKYKIETEIGRGGFGLVYKAYDPEVGRPVAIKVLTGEENKDLLVRFKREANAAGKLKHKNILTIYGYGEHENSPYLVMEYLEGENLETLLASGRQFTLRQKTSIATQVAEGLQHAHHNGVVHRDIKPANIRILPDGSVKIMDFGIARVVGEHSSRLTRQGDFIGTLAYMAPEVFREGEVDELCDIFSFGVVFYQLVTGKNPFASDGPARVIYNLTTVHPPFASALARECPPALDQLIARTIHKERELRYQSFEDVLFDLMPICSLLQSAEIQGLLEQVQACIDSRRLEDAKALVRQILQFEPGNAPARKFREHINLEIQRDANSKRCEELYLYGKNRLESRDYAKAVDAFEGILRLDSSHAGAQSLLQEAQTAIKKRERAKTLMTQAERDLNAGRLTEAYRSMLECVQYATKDSEADALLERIRTAIRDRERQRHLEESLSKAREFLSSSRPEQAEDLLAELTASYPGMPQVEEITSEVRSALEQKRQRQRIEDGMASAEQALSEQRWSDAVEILDPLMREFPADSNLQKVMSRAQAELDAHRKAERISRIVQDVEGANTAGDYDRSVDLLEKASASYPDDAELRTLLERTRSLKSEAERQLGVRLAIDRANTLCAEKKYSAALDEIDLAAGLWGSDELRTFRKGVEAQFRDYQKQQAILLARERIGSLFEKGLYQEAMQEGNKALSRFPGDSDLTALLERAQVALADQQRLKQIEALRERAVALAAHNDFAGALKILRDALEKFDDPSLKVLYERVQADRDRQAHRASIAAAVEEIQKLLDESAYSAAVDAGKRALSQFPDEASLQELYNVAKNSFRDRQRQERIADVDKNIRSLLENKDVSAARRLLKDSVSEFGKHPQFDQLGGVIDSFQREEEKRSIVRETVDLARSMVKSANYAQAIAALESALARYPGEEIMDDLLREAREGYKLQRKSRRIEEIVAECRRQISERNHQAALKVARAGIEEYPDEPLLTSILAEIKGLLAEIEKDRAVRAALASASELEDQIEYERAIEVLSLALERNPSHQDLLDRLSSLKQKAARQRQVNTAVDKVCELMARGLFDEALKNVESAMKSFPDEIAFSTLLTDIDKSRRAEAVMRACRAIEALIASGKLDEAADRVDDALAEFADDPTVDALRLRVEDELQKRERNRKLEALIGDARRLVDQRPEEAVARIRDGLAAYPDSIELKTLLARANQTITNRQREADIRSLTGRAEALLDQGNAREAVVILEDGVRRFPTVSSLAELLQRANTEVWAAEEREREERVNQTLALARSHEEAGRPVPAMRTLQDALRDFPGNVAILSELQRIEATYPELVRTRTGLKVAAIAAILLLVIGAVAGIVYRSMNSEVRTDSGDNPPPPSPPSPPPPTPAKLARIATFTITPDSIVAGGKAQLCYEVQDAVTVMLMPEVPNVKETDSKACFEVAPTETTPFRLTVKNADGVEASESRTIVVSPVDELGTLVVEAGQADVAIRVGSHPIRRSGSNGIVEFRLLPGPYLVVAEKDGFQSAEAKVRVVFGNKPVRLGFNLRKEVPVNLSEAVAAGNLISPLKPVYPSSRGARGAATVRLQVTINKDGTVKEAIPVNGSQPFADAAVDAVKQARYRSHVVGGKQLEVATIVTVVFTPDDKENVPPVSSRGDSPQPPPTPTTDCRKVLDGLKAANNQSGLENFIQGNDCGRPPFSAEAQAYLKGIREQEAERKAWDTVNHQSIQSLQAYLDAHPTGANVSVAKNEIANLRQREAQRRRDVEDISKILNSFSNAIRNRSVDGVKAVYPQANEAMYRADFRAVTRYNRYDISIPQAGPTFTSDNDATVTCQVDAEVVRSGQPLTQTSQITFTLRRDQGTWTIRSLQIK